MTDALYDAEGGPAGGTATGFLVGMDKSANLEVTNSFPFPTVDVPQSDGHHDNNAASNLAAAAPRAKANVSYQTEMIKKLREVNVDANNTGCLQKSNLRYQDILLELPLSIHNSHLLTSFLHSLPNPVPTPEAQASQPPSLTSLSQTPNPLSPNFNSLNLSIDPFLTQTTDLLLESIENHHTELNNYQYYQRQLAREQTKITAWQTKRKSENASRALAKQSPLPEDEWQRLFKLPQEPGRLETLLNSRQVEQYARQVDGFAAGVTGKMFAVRGNLLPGAGEG
ncbi:translation initiation factor 3 subunit H, partial [Lecanoromycetidae sp. Uapishka_2]